MLRILVLSNNPIGDVGATVMAEGLRRSGTLHELQLEGCCVADAGACALADALATNATLEVLFLNKNTIADAGARAFARALCTSALQWLALRENCITAQAEAELRIEGLLAIPLPGRSRLRLSL